MHSSISDIERLIRDAQAVLDWAPVPLGSILRTHAYSYRNWGICLTQDNAEWARAESKSAFSVEWAESGASLNSLIGEAAEKAGLADTNALMNAKIGEYAAAYATPEELCVVDIGAGAGGTSAAVVRALSGLPPSRRPSRVILSMIEPSAKRLEVAEAAVMDAAEGTWMERRIELLLEQGTVERLSSIPCGFADMVVSNAAIHHESFNDHLPQILRVLRDGAPFISGDWHESNYEHPARAYWIYYLLQNPHDEAMAEHVMEFTLGKEGPPWLPERKELSEFRALFRLDSEDVNSAFWGHTESERRADMGSQRYWLEMGKKFSECRKKCPELLLQCHERVSKRTEALMNAGFIFDDESRRRYHEALNGRGFGELAAVMVPKRPLAR